MAGNATRWLRVQAAVLAAGTLFAWATVLGDFQRYVDAGGRLAQFGGTAFRNPVLTPCFYGAVLFLVALVWALALRGEAPDARRRHQRQLVGLLIFGTLFAWGNFGYEMIRYCLRGTAAYRSCSGTVTAHPVFTPCFVGAVLYLGALAAALAARRGLAPAETPGTT